MTKTELKKFLERHRLAPSQFAELIGVTPMAVSHWLNGTRGVSLPISRLCRLFDKYPDLIGEF